MEIIKNKIYCVTGGGGFIANHIIDKIIESGAFVRTIGTNIEGLSLLKNKYKDKIEIINGNIKYLYNIEHLISAGTVGLFHLAAFKYVGLAEKQPRDCIYSNIVGTLNILNISVEQKLEFVVATSTAASVQSSTVYGTTKMLMEKLFNQYQIENPNQKFRIVRLGNILYSTGSVSYKWRESINKGEDIVISNGKSTRFFMSVDDAIDSIFNCIDTIDSKPYIPTIKSMSLDNLLSAMIIKFAVKDSNINIITSILRVGENTHEKLNETGPYSNEVEQYTIEEILEII
jgi:UDP-N-acetylglucosamine 4,6-dehydratase/5-epimerase